jgi:L-amino acid N-acyltransferase YncA
MEIRDAVAADLAAITEIYNDVLMHSTAIYRDEAATVAERTAWWEARKQQGYATLVACDGDVVIGFGSFGDFRQSPGYRFTVEHSVHVHPASRGRGVGARLVKGLIERAAAMGKHVMIGAIDAENAASLRFHERLGFERVAHFKEVGYKFGRFLDLVFVQIRLGRRRVSPEGGPD